MCDCELSRSKLLVAILVEIAVITLSVALILQWREAGRGYEYDTVLYLHSDGVAANNSTRERVKSRVSAWALDM